MLSENIQETTPAGRLHNGRRRTQGKHQWRVKNTKEMATHICSQK